MTLEEVMKQYPKEVISYISMLLDRYHAEVDAFTDADYELHLYCQFRDEATANLDIDDYDFCQIWSAFEDTAYSGK